MNRQRRVRIPVSQLEEFLVRARRALHLPDSSFTVCLVSDAEIARWNNRYRGKKGPTDVLSFPACTETERSARRERRGTRVAIRRKPFAPGSDFDPSPSYLGDIAIAPAVARRNARRFGRSFNEELRILLLHGMLHLLGYDHETDTGQMDRRERRLRRQLGLA